MQRGELSWLRRGDSSVEDNRAKPRERTCSVTWENQTYIHFSKGTGES